MNVFDDASCFDPAEMRILFAAHDRSWLLLAGNGDARGRHERFVKLVLALGVLAAAANGERDVERLSDAACALWRRSLSAGGRPRAASFTAGA